MLGNICNSSLQGSILAGGRRYALIGSMVIGRAHAGCPLEDCRRKGFWRQPDVVILDEERYVGKHHAKLQVDPRGFCWIEDLHSLNGTAILRASKNAAGRTPVFYFELLSPGRGYKLLNGDIVALSYNQTRGPYLTISYHTS